jgi:hypothetical protein
MDLGTAIDCWRPAPVFGLLLRMLKFRGNNPQGVPIGILATFSFLNGTELR